MFAGLSHNVNLSDGGDGDSGDGGGKGVGGGDGCGDGGCCGDGQWGSGARMQRTQKKTVFHQTRALAN